MGGFAAGKFLQHDAVVQWMLSFFRIENDKSEIPSVGQLLFERAYAEQFGGVAIHNRKFVSRFIKVNGVWTWVHRDRAVK